MKATARTPGGREASGHTFVVPAYGRSLHLETCLASLGAQTQRSRIVICTSTPFPGIDDLAARHGAEVFVHGPNRGIGADWNAALDQSRSEWTTIAHQDDTYHPEYGERIVGAGSRARDALVAFCDYAEMRDDRPCPDNSLLRIKRALLAWGFLGRNSISSTAAKRRILCFGNAIPCPAVTYHRRAITGFRFREDLRVSLDWAAWLEFARRPGAFVWVREVLMEHRIHARSETATGLGDGTRLQEDLQLLCSIWPRPIARLILASYRPAYKAT